MGGRPGEAVAARTSNFEDDFGERAALDSAGAAPGSPFLQAIYSESRDPEEDRLDDAQYDEIEN